MNAMGKYDLIFSELSPNVIICQKMPSNLSLTLRPERTISNRRKAASHFLKTGQVYEGDFMQILIFNFKVDLCPEIKDSRPFKKEHARVRMYTPGKITIFRTKKIIRTTLIVVSVLLIMIIIIRQ